MRSRKRWMLGAVLLAAMVLLLVPAIVLAGSDSSTPARLDRAKPAHTTPAAEELRTDRRDSRHGGCSKRNEAFMASV